MPGEERKEGFRTGKDCTEPFFATGSVLIARKKEMCFDLFRAAEKKTEGFMKILFIEDDDKLRQELQRFFAMQGYETCEITDYEHLEEAVLGAQGHLLLLDINLPVTNGSHLCRELRKKTSMPIVMITSQNTEMDELLCMNYGADDFIAKPFHPQILLAHVEAILKRTYQSQKEGERIDCGGFFLDLSKGTAAAGAQEIELTKNESRILYTLAKERGKIVSRDRIINDLWDSELFVDDNTLTVNMTRLRGKLESIGMTDVIRTKRGQGYLLI